MPPASQRILEPLEAREEDEQIVLEGSEEVTQVEQVLFSRDVGSDLPLDLVAIDPGAHEDFVFTQSLRM